MNADCLKLTTYFGETDRTDRGSLVAALLDLYTEHQVAVSIVFRGTEGFGRRHHLHTRSLETLSYDLPIVSIAVDTRERIESILDLVRGLHEHGIVTLERARLLSGPIESEPPGALGDSAKLTIYLGRQPPSTRTPMSVAICDLLSRREIAGASVLTAIDGTREGTRHSSGPRRHTASPPGIIIAVGDSDRVAAILPELASLLDGPLMTLERVRICKRDGQLFAQPHELPGHDDHGLELWQKLTIYCSFSATHHGRNVHSEIIRKLLASDATGATTLAGTWGYHGDHPPHGDKLFQLRRHVPAVTVVIGTPQQIARSFEIVDQLTSEHGLVTSEIVPAMHA